MTSIRFEQAQSPRTDRVCRVCGQSRSKHVLTLAPAPIDGGKLELFGCLGCGSYFYGGADPVLGYDDAGFEPKYWMHYAQIGAGIPAMLSPLFALGERARGALLDVGCGFGFVADFWGRSGRGTAVGLESAVYGEVGRDLLGVEVRPEYFSQCTAIAGRKFDIVFSSEVIEHVTDPTAFLKEISQGLAEAGILVITTPSATIVAPTSDPATLLAALSPGYHYNLLSKAALQTAFKAAGLPHVYVHDAGHQLVAWGSRQPFPRPERARFDWDAYFAYLQHLSENGDPSVKGGALYRMLKDYHGQGMQDRAGVALRRLSAFAADHYGIDLMQPEIGAALQSADLMSRIDQSPAWLGCALVHAGQHVGQASADHRAKLRILDAALRLFRRDIATSPRYTPEPSFLLPLAEQQYRIALADALGAELKAGMGAHVAEGATAPRPNHINDFVGAVGLLAGRIAAAMPAAAGQVARGTVSRWNRSVRKRLNANAAKAS
ncbi:MAG: class I SAM-dependent methyltransferase [Hyphomicrobiaceae bacterium]